MCNFPFSFLITILFSFFFLGRVQLYSHNLVFHPLFFRIRFFFFVFSFLFFSNPLPLIIVVVVIIIIVVLLLLLFGLFSILAPCIMSSICSLYLPLIFPHPPIHPPSSFSLQTKLRNPCRSRATASLKVYNPSPAKLYLFALRTRLLEKAKVLLMKHRVRAARTQRLGSLLLLQTVAREMWNTP